MVGKFYRPIKNLSHSARCGCARVAEGSGARLSDPHQQTSACGDGESIEAKESLAGRADVRRVGEKSKKQGCRVEKTQRPAATESQQGLQIIPTWVSDPAQTSTVASMMWMN